MPYLELNTSVSLKPEEKHILCEDIGKLLPLIPGKTRELTMMTIADGRYMELGDTTPSANLLLRLGGPAAKEGKATFVQEVTALFEAKLGIRPERLYINIIECSSWGANGQYFGAS
jgi:phenylpyruvate tautomerase PptA (4-oxalocrotonate tautomerase family)